jgi:hypothetical protein
MENEPEPKTLKYEPQSIDFGCLIPGKGASATINVYGGPGKVSIRNDQLRASPSIFENKDSEIEITLSAGIPGELIWDEIILRTETQEVNVPVIARWELLPALDTPATDLTTESPAVKVDEISASSGNQGSAFTRQWVGRKCPRCHKNLFYDLKIHGWEQCRCDYSSHTKEGLGNLHTKGKYATKDTSTRIVTIVLIIIALGVAIFPWYPFVVSHNKLWLILSIPLSIVSLPPAIIWICSLKER